MKLTEQEVSIVQQLRKVANGYLHVVKQNGKIVSINILPSFTLSTK